jgi:hypothetical protein
MDYCIFQAMGNVQVRNLEIENSLYILSQCEEDLNRKLLGNLIAQILRFTFDYRWGMDWVLDLLTTCTHDS